MPTTTIGAPSPPAGFHPQATAGFPPFAALEPTPSRASSLGVRLAGLLSGFAARTGNGSWPNLPRTVVSTRLVAVTSDVSKLNQAGLNACGPAAALYLLGGRDIDRFADLAIQLYESARASFGSLSVSGDGLTSKDPASMKWSSGSAPELLDWMLLSSTMRSMGTVIKFGGGPSDSASGISLPGEMEKWLRDGIGYATGVSNEANKFFTKSLSHLRGLTPGSGTDVVLLINVDGLHVAPPSGGAPPPPTPPAGGAADAGTTPDAGSVATGDGAAPPDAGLATNDPGTAESTSVVASAGSAIVTQFPNHWAVLRSPVTDTGSDIRADVWTWGTDHYTVSGTYKEWGDNYYGAVIGRA